MKNLIFGFACLLSLHLPGQSCNYGSSTDASDLCEWIRGNNFASNRNADIALDRILDVTGMSKRFVLKECSNISNCIATTYNGIRYILYDRAFMDAIADETNSWSSISILAHEIGHHINGHTLGEVPSLSESRQMELEADEYSGFVMQKLGASLTQAQVAINTLIPSNREDTYSTHPSRDKRLSAIERGYNKAKGQNSSNDYSTKSSAQTGIDYFYKALNESDYQEQIDNYNKCLRLLPVAWYSAHAHYNKGIAYSNLGYTESALIDFTMAIRMNDLTDVDLVAGSCYNRGIIYSETGNNEDAIADFTTAIKKYSDEGKFLNSQGFLVEDAYYSRGISYYYLGNKEDAIADFTSAIRIDPDSDVYLYARGRTYAELGNYELSIADFTRVIRISPDYTNAFYNRGFSYYNLGNNEDAIADFTRAIRINPDSDLAYSKRGLSYYRLGNNEDAIADFSKAIELNPNGVSAYYYRGLSKLKLGKKDEGCRDLSKAGELGVYEAYDMIKKHCN
jgi:tetratricopeptide (TPR) repeat protein